MDGSLVADGEGLVFFAGSVGVPDGRGGAVVRGGRVTLFLD
ncbi:hypothetical protein [Streptomyces sp. NPDC005322]